MSAKVPSVRTSAFNPKSVFRTPTTRVREEEHVCSTCNKRLPKLNENLLKDSLRMKSEMANLGKHRASLMEMIARNEDFAYPLSTRGGSTRANTNLGNSAASELIDEERYNSVMTKYAEVMRNRGLHDCEKLHKNSRRREYSRWDYSHADLAKFQMKPLMRKETSRAWILDEQEEDYDSDSSFSSDDELKEVAAARVNASVSRVNTTRTGRTGRTSMRNLESPDEEEKIKEADRVQMTVEKLRKGKKGGLLSEIEEIKGRHKQLVELTAAKKRATADIVKYKQSKKQSAQDKMRSDAVKRYLLANANLQKELEFSAFREKTTVKLNRNFNDKEASAKNPGVVWAQKWSPDHNRSPGKISKSTHPAVDAHRKRPKPTYTPVKKGDLPPCVFLPKHIEAKTPMESAILLDRFMKKTVQTK